MPTPDKIVEIAHRARLEAQVGGEKMEDYEYEGLRSGVELKWLSAALDAVAPLPYRGSPVEAWLKACRDQWDKGDARWFAFDDLLDDYRERADTGRRLDEES